MPSLYLQGLSQYRRYRESGAENVLSISAIRNEIAKVVSNASIVVGKPNAKPMSDIEFGPIGGITAGYRTMLFDKDEGVLGVLGIPHSGVLSDGDVFSRYYPEPLEFVKVEVNFDGGLPNGKTSVYWKGTDTGKTHIYDFLFAEGMLLKKVSKR